MRARPWVKWYWSDWRSDPCLRMCSLAARGLWAEMLALMHEATPYGHLLINSVAPTDTQLAVLAGASSEQIPDLLGELDSAGVFSRTQKGVIFSRRMTRDEKRSRVAQKNGKNGGNPSLSKERENKASDKGSLNPWLNTQKPEARSQRPEVPFSSVPSEPSSNGRAAPARDERTELFRSGLASVIAMTGKPEPGARALIGRWLKQTGDDCRTVRRLIEDAERDRRADPVAWIEAHFRPRTVDYDEAYRGVQTG